jgi:two-component system LytT family response regulator
MLGNTYTFLIIHKEKSDIGKIRGVLKDVMKAAFDVKIADNIQEALKILSGLPIDLIFIDLGMAQKNGIELLNYFPPSLRPTIILMSEANKFQVDMLNAGIFYYLLKPFRKEQVTAMIDRFLNERVRKNESDIINLFIENAMAISGNGGRVALPGREHLELVAVNQIIRCESESNYTHIYTITGSKYTVPKTLKEIEKALSPFFFRIHRSHIINLNMAKKINNKDLNVEMINGKIIPISEDRKSLLMGKVKISFNQNNGALLMG